MGINFFAVELTAKRLELLREVVPAAVRSMGGIDEHGNTATAFGLRSNPYHFEILGFWDQTGDP